jgi:hypothetical protein
MLKSKTIHDFNNKIGNIIHKFSIQGKYKILGSNSFRGLLYPSDIDIDSTITEPAKVLARHFQKLFSQPLPFIFLDFKAGTDSTKEDGKMRWTPQQLKKGVNKSKTLETAIQEDMLIKLDFVVPVGDTFAEVSEIYETRYQTPKTRQEIEKELEKDIENYTKEGNAMKALKRFFSLLNLTKGDKKIKNRLIHFFNSEVGYINKCANDLELLEQIKTQISKQEYINNIQMIKEKLGRLSWVNQLHYLDELQVGKMIQYLRNLISPIAKEELRKIHEQSNIY